jgi:hypothetical protein
MHMVSTDIHQRKWMRIFSIPGFPLQAHRFSFISSPVIPSSQVSPGIVIFPFIEGTTERVRLEVLKRGRNTDLEGRPLQRTMRQARLMQPARIICMGTGWLFLRSP